MTKAHSWQPADEKKRCGCRQLCTYAYPAKKDKQGFCHESAIPSATSYRIIYAIGRHHLHLPVRCEFFSCWMQRIGLHWWQSAFGNFSSGKFFCGVTPVEPISSTSLYVASSLLMQRLIFNWFTISQNWKQLEKKIILEIYSGYKSWICWIQSSSGGSAPFVVMDVCLDSLCWKLSSASVFWRKLFCIYVCYSLCPVKCCFCATHIFGQKEPYFHQRLWWTSWVNFFLVCFGGILSGSW